MSTQEQVKLGLSFDLALVPQHLMSLLLRVGGILGGLHALRQLGTAPLRKDKTHLGQGLCSQPGWETADVVARSSATEMTRKGLERADGETRAVLPNLPPFPDARRRGSYAAPASSPASSARLKAPLNPTPADPLPG